MTVERIKRIERELADAQTKITELSLAVTELTRSAARRRVSIQSAVDGLQRSLKLIFKNVKVPNVTYDPGARHIIE